VAADKDELDSARRLVEFFGDVDHHLRAVASEENDGGGAVGLEAEARSFGYAIDGSFSVGPVFVKPGLEDHSRGLEDVVVGDADGQCLLTGAIGSGDDVFGLALDPEVGRVIGEIGDEGDEGRFGGCRCWGIQALGDFTVEVRDHGENEIGGILRPVVAQQFHNRLVVEADGGFEDDEQLGREARPAVAQDHVVGVLNAEAGRAADEIEWIEQFLNVEESDVPGMFLRGECGLESVGGAAMASASVVEDDG